VEYGKVFIPKWFRGYNNMIYSSYPEYLQAKYNNFFTRLISCPFCLGFWVALIIVSMDNMLLLPVIYCGGVAGYFGVVILAKKSYD
jgi:hypothetical protein